MKSNGLNYKDAGVDIDAGNELVERIKPLVKSTARTGSNPDLGGFGGLFDIAGLNYKDPIFVAGNDGVGTKLEIAKIVGKHDTVGIDLVAMVVNDLIVQGAEPLFFLDYLASGKLDVLQATEVISGIAQGCKQSKCALIGGETAEMPGMYKNGDYDLAGFAVGIVERDNVLPKIDKICQGDVLLGLASSGVHSNGFSLVRKIIEVNDLSYSKIYPLFAKSLGEILLEPTKIYVQSCLSAINNFPEIKALAHITGGGITENLPRVLPDNYSAEINLSSWKIPDIFTFLQENGGVSDSEMLRAFNCGIGMVMVVDKNSVKDVTEHLVNEGEQVFEIGKITKSSDKLITYNS